MIHKTDFVKVLRTLQQHHVEFIVVGGVSAVLHGAPVTTFDLDILHHRTEANVERLLDALKELDAHYRVKKELKIEPTKAALMGQGHHLLLTNAGSLDVLGIVGTLQESKDYQDLLLQAKVFSLAGLDIQTQALESLIEIKRLIGRGKDLAVIPVLEQTLREKKVDKSDSPKGK